LRVIGKTFIRSRVHFNKKNFRGIMYGGNRRDEKQNTGRARSG